MVFCDQGEPFWKSTSVVEPIEKDIKPAGLDAWRKGRRSWSSHVDPLYRSLALLSFCSFPQLIPLKDKHSSLPSLEHILSLWFFFIVPAVWSLAAFSKTIYFLPPLSNCCFTSWNQTDLLPSAFRLGRGARRCLWVRARGPQSRRLWAGTLAGRRCSSTNRKPNGRRDEDLPGTSCSTSSYFNIYRMLSPLKCKIGLLSPYVQIFYKCRYTHFML